jgi:tetratricopeptide (TPR) repeat protein
MKKIYIFILCTLIFLPASGQDLIELISLRVCNCIDTIENIDSLQAKFDRCINESVEVFWNSDDDEQLEHFATSDTVARTIDAVMGRFMYYCPKVKQFILKEKEALYYKLSESEAAKNYYELGNKAFNANDFKTAEKEYLKAIKADPGFVYAYDNLGLTYRGMKEYRKAVDYYGKSLVIFPEGSFALQNQAVAYTYLKDNEKALSNYITLINLYPDNPEGYFGSSKVYYQNGDLENALDFVLIAHKIYVLQGSEFVKDTEKQIALIHEKMKAQNKQDVFNRKVKEHGFSAE